MSPRPTSVTVIAWLLIVLSGLGFLSMAMMSMLIGNPIMQQTLASNPLPPMAVLSVGYLGSLVGLLSGIGCLKRWGWARYVYVVWCAVSVAFNLYTTRYSALLLIPGVAICLVVIVFMFLPKARAWFSERAPT